ncbi:acetyl-CoA sensor PanZ family protein [Faucicola atlantae]|uniref:Uncharacterized protein n=2 Tax=Faucicola atlantae TaxID=34059 RepID=A0A1B8Q9J2_9GAMM|nr:GNAT family N-acetyltransferase [Moraxella atlantae]OBX75436.1 hypothetical protein A9306_02440 [Moraxella atlantae]
MPLESIAIQDFSHNRIDDPELAARIAKLYEDSHEFADGQTAIATFNGLFARGGRLYVGMFNDRPIAAVASLDDGTDGQRRLAHLAVHPANRGRAIDAKLIKQTTDSERKLGIVRFASDDGDILRILTHYELLG